MKRFSSIFLAGAVILALWAPGRAEPQSYLGKSPTEWQKQLAAKDAKARRDAAFALGKMGPVADEALGDLLKLLQRDPDKSVRDSAAYSLGQICKRGRAPEEVIDALCKCVADDADGNVKRSCAVALGHCAADSAVVRAALGKALDDVQNPGVRQNAAWALGEICKRSEDIPLKELRRGLQDADKLVKRDAALALKIVTMQGPGERLAKVKEQADKAVGDLLNCAKDEYLELRKAALAALANLPLEEHRATAVPILAKACNDAKEDLEVRLNAALCLANVGGEEALPAVPVLRAVLRNGDIEQKRLVAVALHQLGPAGKDALDDLCRALTTSKDLELRVNAATGLGGLKREGHDAVPQLAKIVCDSKDDYRVRVAAAVSMQTIGPCAEATRVLPDLLRVLDDPKQPVIVRERILWAARVHGEDLRANEPFIAALKKILIEPGLGSKRDEATGAASGKMLRYDAAFLISYFKGAQAPDATLDVLNEFLHDESIRRYTGRKINIGSGGGEGEKATKGGAVEQLAEDARFMAIIALGLVGDDRVIARKAIIEQLRAMSPDNSPYELKIQKAAKELLKKLGV
jgi:HEAT repeat protein